MSILKKIFRAAPKNTAAIAKERLQIIVAHERVATRGGDRADFLSLLQKELIDVIAKYVDIDADQVKVDLDSSGDRSILELNITLPDHLSKDVAAAKAKLKQPDPVN